MRAAPSRNLRLKPTDAFHGQAGNVLHLSIEAFSPLLLR